MPQSNLSVVCPCPLGLDLSSSRYIKNYTTGLSLHFQDFVVERFLLFSSSKTTIFRKIFNKLLSCSPLFNLIRLSVFERFFVKRYATRLLCSIASSSSTWVLLSSPEIAITIDFLIKNKALDKFHTTLLDSWDYQLDDCLHLFNSQKVRLKKIYLSVLMNSFSVATMGENMNFKLIEHGLESSKLHCMPPVLLSKNRLSSAIAINNGHTINLVFAGNLYAKEAWNLFAQSLDDINLRSPSVHFHVNHFGKLPLHGIYRGNCVSYRGHIPHSQLIEQLKLSDFAILPYSNSKITSDVFMTSFPSKLLTYIEASLPIIYVGSLATEPAKFIEKHKIGIVFDSNQLCSISDHLLNLDSQKILAFKQNVRIVADNLFSRESRFKAVCDFLSLNK